MKYVGAHVSTGGGLRNAPLNAVNIGAKAFALFLKNQRQWNANPLRDSEITEFQENCRKGGFDTSHIIPHASYLINLGNPDSAGLKRSISAFIGELQRCEALDLKFLNFHPGSNKKLIQEDECLNIIADSLNMALEKTHGVTALIENTAGQGGYVGYRFEHIAYLIDKVKDKSRIGVCLDTCHLFGAGYEIHTETGLRQTLEDFEIIVGLKYLKVLHINDAKCKLGSRVDRHENLGMGNIGLETFRRIMRDERFDELPLILETPDPSNWHKEISTLYSFI